VRVLKLTKQLVSQLIFHSLDASYDLFRYLRYSNSFLYSSDNRQKLESLLFFYYHKIEKGLAMPTVKPLFGLGYIETTLELAEKWVQRTSDQEAVVFRGAYAALADYQKHVAKLLSQARPDIVRHLDQFLTDYAQPDQDLSCGGTITISKKEKSETCQSMNFERFVYQRHSVRSFVERHIPDTAIVHAVKLAQRTPSVCNRQCWRVHIFTSPADKARILQHQNGNEGFGHLADRVLLITADLRSFLSSGERHQASVESGMFAMTLILAFEAQGIASCCLNLCLSAFGEIALRRESRISEWEIPIMLIVIGYPPESLQVAISARKSTESMLTFHNLDQEDSPHDKRTMPSSLGG
jgi:nitroreductase